ncbi:Bug family tripartite tricarboxylate transporter substrate binding protein [Tardiphaga sp. 866_E4_N2_1]|jgi:tripartite-type tricarboxylate transporter receptor subunit TctC|uniref:Bug family tripartite tricarboxylate transporter substrate binding protein n=1 Tax=unclassified Tardiphaga TaxID=2631404 RepID=UPI0008A81301|nr:tripartite tricarboxylate transporter substrate binding protein [Tardiphaga sp. OK245]SEH81179.1 Tripartite-type tricarboxylate transporter, receptor component TctC [Tardiphaga sp. OK245]
MKRLLVAALLMGTGLSATTASAQEWPTKPIKLVVPYAPGGYTDAVGRITARFLEKELGQTVIVDNRAGAGGIVGSDLVSKSPGDGYTLCVCSVGAISIAPVAQTTSYDPVKSFKPISVVSTIPQTVIVNPSLPINSMEDLVKYAKANPGKLTYGSSGAGGLMYFSVALFDARVGTKMTHVPFKGGSPATAAVVAGEVNLSFTNMTDALPQIEANTVRALAVTSATRSEFTPKLPTVAETVSPGYAVESWNGIMAPASTPDAIVEKVSAALKKMAADPEVKKNMAVAGASTVFTTPAEYTAQITKEVEQWRTLLKEISEKKT